MAIALRPTLLVTGASGFLGRYVCHLARPLYHIQALTSRPDPPALAGVDWHRCDLLDRGCLDWEGWDWDSQDNGPLEPNPLDRTSLGQNPLDYDSLHRPALNSDSIDRNPSNREPTPPPSFTALLDRLQPQAVLHLAAEANTNRCQQDPQRSDRLNRQVPIALAHHCGDRQIPFLFTSTGLVFDGNHPPYRESDPVNPLMLYGQQKAAAEAGVLALGTAALIPRLPLLFGTGEWPASNFMETLHQSLAQGQSVNLFTDEYRTPVSGWTAAWGLVQAVGWAIAGQRGLIHLGGADRISRYELGLRFAHGYGYDAALLRPCSRSILGNTNPRPADTSLNSDRARALGYQPPSLDQQLRTCPYPPALLPAR